MSIEEAILEKVRRLPPAKQEDLLNYAENLLRAPLPEIRRVHYRDRTRELLWLRLNRDKYPDHWIAVEGDQLIAADPDADKVFAAVDAAGIEIPFVVHNVPPSPFPFGGW